MNKLQLTTMRAILLVSMGFVLLMSVLYLVRKGVLVFLTFLAIFIILYGLGLLGVWSMLYAWFLRLASWFTGKISHRRSSILSGVHRKRSYARKSTGISARSKRSSGRTKSHTSRRKTGSAVVLSAAPKKSGGRAAKRTQKRVTKRAHKR